MYVSRDNLFNELSEFANQPGPGFLYVRGRRRVGKSWLLTELESQIPERCFLFQGRAESSKTLNLTDFVKAWDQFAKDSEGRLSDLKPDRLSWKMVFDEIRKFAIRKFKVPLVLIFDEIQWIASERSGFVSSLKEAWVRFEKEAHIKVIVCGSSARFFSKFVGGETKILRGLKTHSDLWVDELPLHIVATQVFPRWKTKEIILTYMLIGGIPYYVKQLNPNISFIRSVNEAIFTKRSIFLEEWQEVLTVEFNALGLSCAARVLGALLQGTGNTIAEISEISGLNHDTAQSMLMKLCEYGYLKEMGIYKSHKAARLPRTKRGTYYTIDDFYLHTYATILRPNMRLIEQNENGLVFPTLCFVPGDSFYIPRFSGHAFERLVARIIKKEFTAQSSLGKKLQLADRNFDVLRNIFVRGATDTPVSEIDVLAVHEKERHVCVVECKWTEKEDLQHIQEVISKHIPYQYQGYFRTNVLAVGYSLSKGFLEAATKLGVNVVTLEDLLGLGLSS